LREISNKIGSLLTVKIASGIKIEENERNAAGLTESMEKEIVDLYKNILEIEDPS